MGEEGKHHLIPEMPCFGPLRCIVISEARAASVPSPGVSIGPGETMTISMEPYAIISDGEIVSRGGNNEE